MKWPIYLFSLYFAFGLTLGIFDLQQRQVRCQIYNGYHPQCDPIRSVSIGFFWPAYFIYHGVDIIRVNLGGQPIKDWWVR